MISDDIIRQSAHKQMLEALPKQCQLSRCVFPPTYYLYRAFKFVMLMTPCVSMQEGAREELNGAAAWLKMHLRGRVEVRCWREFRWACRRRSWERSHGNNVFIYAHTFHNRLTRASCWCLKGTAVSHLCSLSSSLIWGNVLHMLIFKNEETKQ